MSRLPAANVGSNSQETIYKRLMDKIISKFLIRFDPDLGSFTYTAKTLDPDSIAAATIFSGATITPKSIIS